MEDGQLLTEKAFIVGNFEEQLPANDPDYLRIDKTRLDTSVVHIAAYPQSGGQQEFLEYQHRDHLGSVEKVTDESGQPILDTAFDPFGNRRSADWAGQLDEVGLKELLQAQGITTRRGFTGHEHLDRTGLIHMNGRIFDPTLGRFLSADPVVQAPTTSLNWNRYSYVLNNPLSLVDPSGYMQCAYTWRGEESVLTCGGGGGGGWGNWGASFWGGGGGSGHRDGLVDNIGGGGYSSALSQQKADDAEKAKEKILNGCEDSGVNCSSEWGGAEDDVTNVNTVTASFSDGYLSYFLFSIGVLTDAMPDGSFGITSKGNFRFYANNWRGNQYISTIRTRVALWGGPVAATAVFIGAVSDFNDVQDGRQSADIATINNIGSAIGLRVPYFGWAAFIMSHWGDRVGSAMMGGALAIGPNIEIPGANFEYVN